MSVRVSAPDGQGLLDEIRKQIDHGQIETWARTEDAGFRHVTPDGQWADKAWLKPELNDNSLRFILRPRGKAVAREVFAVYQCRFIEMLIKHVPDKFKEARASSNPEGDDASIQG